jgi:hypothetical protein
LQGISHGIPFVYPYTLSSFHALKKVPILTHPWFCWFVHILSIRQLDFVYKFVFCVACVQYEEAVWRKQELIAYDKQMDVDFLQVLQQLKSLYLERMGIFFKL